MYDHLSAARRLLWLGAHKTGTTFLQGMLDASASAMSEAGAAYMSLDTFREKYTRPLLFKNNEDTPAPASDFPIGAGTTVLFDENIPGLVHNAVSPEAGLYPEMEERVGKIMSYLNYTPDLLLFGIRALDGYLPSLYCETLKSTPFQTFHRFLQRVPADLQWYPTLQRLAAQFEDVPMVVYRAEDLRGHERTLLSTLTGVPVDALQADEKQERPGFSHAAIHGLKVLSKTREVVRADVSAMVQEFPKSADNPGFAPFGGKRKIALKALYAQDCAQIAADPRMTLLDFDALTA
jgi:hypothetical protein